MDITFKTQGHDGFMLGLPSIAFDGVEFDSAIEADVSLSNGPVGVSATFAVQGIPEFIAVDEGGDPIDGWDSARVEIPTGIDMDWQTIVEAVEEATNWRSALGVNTSRPTNLKVGMMPFPFEVTPVRALQRIAWIELDDFRITDFATFRIDDAKEIGGPNTAMGPVMVKNGSGALVEADFTITIGLLGSVSVESV